MFFNLKRNLRFCVLQFVVGAYNIWGKFLILCLRKPAYTKKYRYSICAIFKDEAPFLKEWIEYHLLIGFDHFFMYNNNSTDNYLDVLEPYIIKGQVTLVDWVKAHDQLGAYKNFYEQFRSETQWISFLDIDEFFCPKYVQSIGEWLAKYESYPVVLIYWKMFGSSGKMQHDYSQLVTEQYTVAWDHLHYIGKCLINTDYDIIHYDATTHHCPKVYWHVGGLKIMIAPVNIFKRFILYNIHFRPSKELEKATIQINHYWSKAWDIYDLKRKRTDVFFAENPKKKLDYYYYHECENRTCDYMIFRFLMKLKLAMKGIV